MRTPASSTQNPNYNQQGGLVKKTEKTEKTETPGSGVICETRALPGAVIPAKAGIHCASHWKCAADGVDSRLRGNDQCFEGDPIPKDTTTETPSRNGGCSCCSK